jgi:hypothetical protein
VITFPTQENKSAGWNGYIADVERDGELLAEPGQNIGDVYQPHPLVSTTRWYFHHGERQYTAADLAGHRWTFTHSLAAVDSSHWAGVLLE